MNQHRAEVVDFIQAGKDRAEKKAKALKAKNLANSIASKSQDKTICTAIENVKLDKNSHQRIDVALHEIDIALQHIKQAKAALKGYSALSMREIGLSENLLFGYQYVLNEHIHINKAQRELEAKYKAARLRGQS